MTARHSDWWSPLLVLALLVAAWLTLLNRADNDNARAIREASIKHGDIAQAVANHSDLVLEKLRLFSQILLSNPDFGTSSRVVQSSQARDPSLLRLIRFDASGHLPDSSGLRPEPWMLEAAQDFAAHAKPDGLEHIVIATVPPLEHARAWQLPIFYQPAVARDEGSGFVLALVDLRHLSRDFGEIMLGKSGEIILVANDERELLRMREGRPDAAGGLVDSARLRLAFAEKSGLVSGLADNSQPRLYAYRRIPSSPLAVLVSRTRDEVLLENQAAQRGYFGAALLMSALMVFLTVLSMLGVYRRRLLIRSLTKAQDNTALLIKQIEKEKDIAYHLATYDQLTGLPNRMLFAELASRYVMRARRIRGRFAVMFIDLDRFKPINDRYGHKTGDQLLIDVSQRLKDCMRQTDVVSRYGGDEFVALLADLRNTQDAALIAEKIIESLSQPYVGLVDAEIRVTPSIGIAFYPDDADRIDTLIRQADTAMYQAKERGRATFAFADPALNRRLDLCNQIEAALPSALLNREFQVHFQPKVALRDFSITGLEALVRWNHPLLGPISPGDFIPVAEQCGAIVDLGEYVIAEVCRQLEAWSQAGVPTVPVAVNVSPRQLYSPTLFDFIAKTLKHHGVEPRLLQIEITETGLVKVDDGFSDVLYRLDELGVHLAIDDFGTGYSGLSHLRALPVRYLKIDRSFIQDIRNDTNDAAIVSNTISLSHSLKLITIAEGVETMEQVAHLKAARCDQAQGYFFSRPCDATRIEPLLRQKYATLRMDQA